MINRQQKIENNCEELLKIVYNKSNILVSRDKILITIILILIGIYFMIKKD